MAVWVGVNNLVTSAMFDILYVEAKICHPGYSKYVQYSRSDSAAADKTVYGMVVLSTRSVHDPMCAVSHHVASS